MSRILGYISILWNLLLGIFLFGLGLVGMLSGHEKMEIALVPIGSESAALALVCGGLLALASVLFAFKRNAGPRILLTLWSFLVVVLLLAAFFRGSYQFDGVRGLQMWLVYLAVSVVAFIGSFANYRHAKRR